MLSSSLGTWVHLYTVRGVMLELGSQGHYGYQHLLRGNSGVSGRVIEIPSLNSCGLMFKGYKGSVSGAHVGGKP